NTVTLDQAQIRAPSDPGYEPAARPEMTPAAALSLLQGAGYRVEPNSSASPAPTPANTGPPEVIRGRISKDGQQLSLAIGVAANDPTSVAVANTAADQLRNVGIAATVLALDPVTLYRDALNDGRVDAIVGWHQAGGNLATRLASRYGCPALQSTQV
ncbi:ABC transporter family substrate-binding protein, partial [Mycobacterium tuberculosis]